MRRRRAPERRVHIIVQNLPVPLDRRVWLECEALTNAGYKVSVVSPKGPGDPTHQVIGGIELSKYRPYPPTKRKIGFVGEYVYSFIMTAWLTIKAWRKHRFDVLQTCNPPDIFWPLGLLFRLVGGCRFVYDQHDLCPELYESRFPGSSGVPYRAVRLFEWCTYRTADHVIATNGSYRSVAMTRGGKRPDEATIVRTGPDPDRLRRQDPDPTVRRGRRFLVCYIGVMGPQDGADLVLRAAELVVHKFGRDDVSFTLIGTGDCFDELLALREELKLQDYVEFTGRAPDEVVSRVFSTADVGLSPDPMNPLNNVSTMNKTMEYMAFSLPVVAFDLRETRVSAQEAAVYIEPEDIVRYAEAIIDLLDDERRRRAMGTIGRARIETELAWHHQRGDYVAVYDRLLSSTNGHGAATPTSAPPE